MSLRANGSYIGPRPAGPTNGGSGVASGIWDLRTAQRQRAKDEWPFWLFFVPIPIMTSATSPSGTASESGTLTGSSFAWKAMDKATASGDTTFYAAPSPSTNAWAQYDYGYTVSIGGYSLTSRQLSPFGRTQAPSQWTFSGSTDGTTFTTIETRSIAESSWAEAGETKTFMLASPATYRAFRWTWNSNPSAGAVVLPKVQMLAPAT